MSSISSRPRVQRIQGSILTSLAAGGVVLAAQAVRALIAKSAPTTEKLGRALPAEHALLPVGDLRDQYLQRRREALDQAQNSLPEVETLRAAALASLDSTPFCIENTSVLRAQCLALQNAGTRAEIRKAEHALLDVLTVEHQQIFANAIALACQRAAVRLGFDRVDVVRLPDEVRVIAVDPSGRTLVSEIQSHERETGITTEVVGVLDGSCQPLLDRFDQSLEEEGVRSGPPQRRSTGGVCELAAARAIARDRWKPLAKPQPAAIPEEQETYSRARRLNAPTKLTVRSRG